MRTADRPHTVLAAALLGALLLLAGAPRADAVVLSGPAAEALAEQVKAEMLRQRDDTLRQFRDVRDGTMTTFDAVAASGSGAGVARDALRGARTRLNALERSTRLNVRSLFFDMQRLLRKSAGVDRAIEWDLQFAAGDALRELRDTRKAIESELRGAYDEIRDTIGARERAERLYTKLLRTASRLDTRAGKREAAAERALAKADEAGDEAAALRAAVADAATDKDRTRAERRAAKAERRAERLRAQAERRADAAAVARDRAEDAAAEARDFALENFPQPDPVVTTGS